MSWFRRVTMAAAVGVMAGCATLTPSTDNIVIRAKREVAPALVHIRPVKEVYSEGKREEVLVVGSGFIISPDGYVVTNEHVAGESKLVRCVLSDKEEVEAEVIGTDRFTDVAVLKLKGDGQRYPTVRLGHSADLEAGQAVLALGSPHGLARSVSLGIVSVTDRYLEDRGEMVSPYNNWIQTDAAINPGNSGGPLVNLRGEVVGINARVLGGAENLGFAIPIDTAKEVVDQIIKNGRVLRSWIGVTFQEMLSKTDDPTQKGVVIADIDPLSLAYEAGIRPGDVLLSVDGVPTDARFEEDLPPLRKLIADLPIGHEAVLKVSRANESLEFRVKTVEKSDLKGQEVEFAEWGFTALDLTPDMVRRAQLPEAKGVFVSGTQVGGLAHNAGLQRGDIVLKIDEQDVGDLAFFKSLYDARIKSKQPLVLLDVKRGALARYVLIKEHGSTEPAEPVEESEGAIRDEE